MALFKEFKTFVMRGNVIDMAVGIVIGGAFGKIISSFVSDIIMPPIGVLLGGVDFKDLKYIIQEATTGGNGEVLKEAVSINYGTFFNVVIEFLIIAMAIFMVIRQINKMKKKEEEAPASPPEPTKEETLLTEIRDLLAK